MLHTCRSYSAVMLIAVLQLPSGAQEVTPKSFAEPRKQLVTVDDGVQLEIVDWGGSGRSLVLLAGLGGTADTFNGFAETH
jgi:non-heme chloroperoxidase